MNKFEVGKTYECQDASFSPITIIKRTPKSVVVENEVGNRWMMRIKYNEKGSEFVVDSNVPYGWKDVFVYNSDWEIK